MNTLRPSTLIAWAACLLAVLLASIWGRPDIPIDETRYVSVAWEMWAGGDWLGMHRNGEPYHHKPPLLFWLIGMGWSVLGVNDWWPRSISTVFSFASLLLTSAIAHRLWPGEGKIGARAGWLLLGCGFWLFFSTAVVFDVMLTAFVLLALLAALRARDGERRGTWGLFGLAIGLGVLAKGPVVLLHVLPPLLLAPWWAGRGNVGKRWYGGIGAGVLLGAGIALAWAVPAAIQGGEEFRHAIFWGQTAGRVSGSLAHKQPFWFYLAVLPLLLFPWVFWGRAWRAAVTVVRDSGNDAGLRFCLAWIIPAFIGFSLAGGKQAHYILPLLPACMLALAYGLLDPRSSSRWAVLPLTLVLAALGGALLLSDHWVSRFWFAGLVEADWKIGGGLVLLAGLLSLWATARGAVCRLAAVIAGVVMIGMLCLLAPLSPAFDMEPLAGQLKRLEEQRIPVAHASAYNDQYHFYGRLNKPLVVIGREEIAAWLEKNPKGRVVAYLKNVTDLDKVKAEFSQRYLDGAVVLLDRVSVQRMPGGGR